MIRCWATNMRWLKNLSFPGLLAGSLFFAASLSPSLVPRGVVAQGVLSGTLFAIGYGLMVLVIGIGRYLGWRLTDLSGYSILRLILAVMAATICAGFLWRAQVWQNALRQLMGMEPLVSFDFLRLALVAGAVAVVLFLLVYLIRLAYTIVVGWLDRFIPHRSAIIGSSIVVTILIVMSVNGILFRVLLHAADSVFAALDRATAEGISKPKQAEATGSSVSRIPWNTIGRRGKDFLATGPTTEGIAKFNGRQANRPIRVYVGIRSAKTPEARARLALSELKRVGAFQRSILILATPTGTGWLDPAGVDTVEYIHNGNTAIASIQYSYLPSWMTIMIDPSRAKNTAQALFKEVYAYWKTLPKASRPDLYLHGLSLGAFGSQESTSVLALLEDIIQGAVWSGPPFPSAQWRALTQARLPSSPAWLPRIGNSSVVRFTAQKNALDMHDAKWGPLRIVYIQHASDPMVFFSPQLLYRAPDWLRGQRGPDVSPYFSWYPVVTFFQMALDVALATSPPIGHGHNYTHASYIDAWVAVTSPRFWSPAMTEKLKSRYKHLEGVIPAD